MNFLFQSIVKDLYNCKIVSFRSVSFQLVSLTVISQLGKVVSTYSFQTPSSKNYAPRKLGKVCGNLNFSLRVQ